jgi:hypothetical protein
MEQRMKRQLVLEQWNSFARQVLPADVSEVQRTEMRRAFYAGAQALFHGVLIALSPDAEPTEADLQFMSDLESELSEFGRAVKEGRA